MTVAVAVADWFVVVENEMGGSLELEPAPHDGVVVVCVGFAVVVGVDCIVVD